MGNEFCINTDVTSQQSNRVQLMIFQNPKQKGDINPISQSVTPNHEDKKDLNFSPPTSKNSIVEFKSEIKKISYKNCIIFCQSAGIKYSKFEGDNTPIINGMVKIYDSGNEKELIYQGELKNSTFYGYGKLFRGGKLLYQGQFKNNLFDGWGITSQYTGQFREGLYDGYGVYREFLKEDQLHLAIYYEGYFQRGLYSGSGVLIKGCRWPVQELQSIHNNEGIFQFLNEQIQYGMSLISVYGAKQIYIGQFSNGFKHGFGRHFTSQMQFSGQFSYNLYHGLGTIFSNKSEGKKVINAVFQMGKQLSS